ncbi:MAG: xanthine phosphoribosyltransferase [Pseudomonadota bacterium]|nr:xanthine phosphoribosyltransferase [Pseudomonadota bacterium]
MTGYTADKYVTWDDVQDRCRILAHRIMEQGCPYKKILAITRGGFFPAGILARELDIRNVETVCIDTYTVSAQRGDPVILKPPAPEYTDEVIVVDDLVDTGSTLALLKQHLKRFITVTIFAKPRGESLVDLYHEKVPQDTWVRFPWDTYRQYVKPLALMRDAGEKS